MIVVAIWPGWKCVDVKERSRTPAARKELRKCLLAVRSRRLKRNWRAGCGGSTSYEVPVLVNNRREVPSYLTTPQSAVYPAAA